MLDKFKKLISTGADVLLADRTIPIAEGVINAALAKFAADIPELSSLSLDIQEGSFELVAEVRKVVTVKSRTRLAITSC